MTAVIHQMAEKSIITAYNHLQCKQKHFLHFKELIHVSRTLHVE